MIRALACAVAVVLVATACSGDSAEPTPTPSVTLPAAPSHAPTPAPNATPEPTAPEASAAEPTGFFNGSSSADTAYAQLVNEGRDADAALIKTIADQPVSTWLGDWQSNDVAGSTAARITRDAATAGEIPVFVMYAIPGRDCGLYSAGGLPEQEYLGFAQAVADGIEEGGGTAWVVLEPDALAQLGDCDGQGDRAGLLAGAAEVLNNAGASVFLDVGNSNWNTVDVTVDRINQVGTAYLTGFATNTSNYNTTADERAWGEQIAERTGLVFLVDTSRNGNGSDGQWCNPRGRALGDLPQLLDDGPMVATVWVKAPGESDGTCNGGPPAGQWWMDIALELASNA